MKEDSQRIGAQHAAPRTTDEDPDVTITFRDQSSDGRYVVVEELSTTVDIYAAVRHNDRGELSGMTLEAGESHTDFEFELREPISEEIELELSVNAYPVDGGSSYDRDTAQVQFTGDGPDLLTGFEPTKIDAHPEEGFEYPFYLYAPDKFEDEPTLPLLVQPNNTGTVTDDFDEHRERTESTIEGGFGRRVTDRLSTPLLVPVFPRPESNPVDWRHYVHALDDTTMQIDDGPLERVDLQLLAMAEYARDYLDQNAYPVADGLALNGFSASGTFVERFAALHPDKVTAVSAGGLNGMVTLPVDQLQGQTLRYPVGTADLEESTDEPFNREAFAELPQFLYLGEFDGSDTIPYSDAWTKDRQRELALEIYGREMQRDRFPTCRAIHERVDTNAIFRMYAGVGHRPRTAEDDVVAFHRQVATGEDVDELRPELAGNVPNRHASIRYAPAEPAAGTQIAFDATRSSVPDGTLETFEWDFDDGRTETGAQATHTFDSPGVYRVTLTTTDDASEQYRSTVHVRAVDADGGDD